MGTDNIVGDTNLRSLEVNKIMNINERTGTIYKHVLLDSGAEVTITNDLSLFYEDTLVYLDIDHSMNIVGVDGKLTAVNALGIISLTVVSQCNTCIEINLIAAYIQHETIGTIVSENDLTASGCNIHKLNTIIWRCSHLINQTDIQ